MSVYSKGENGFVIKINDGEDFEEEEVQYRIGRGNNL